ncbi:MAG: NAD-dependent epimerase/dehydratase family protein [Nocardioides sp.]|uniref:NAD-dependent epimerase/dehydratase family protein n=1 Tax=Nocardioides sp. TaxID=35761 RepID=UPI0039E54EF4
MAGRVVLVTGVSRDLGRKFAVAAAEHPNVERVIGVDVVPPRGDVGGVTFVRADIRNPVIAKVIAREDVDTVVHMSIISTPGPVGGGRTTMKELNVIGTMQLLAACQKAESVRNLVVKSTTMVYGASHRDPAMFTEDMEPRHTPRSGYGKDVSEIEGYVRGLARRRPDINVTVLRCANVIGPRVGASPITSYLRMPVIPTVLGFDPRMQFLHETDLLNALGHAIRAERPGTYNIAGPGLLNLSQVTRRLARPTLPMPGFAIGGIGNALRSVRLTDFSPELRAYLTFGRGVDTARMREQLGFEPVYSTAEALDDFATTLDPVEHRLDGVLASLEGRLEGHDRRTDRRPEAIG